MSRGVIVPLLETTVNELENDSRSDRPIEIQTAILESGSSNRREHLCHRSILRTGGMDHLRTRRYRRRRVPHDGTCTTIGYDSLMDKLIAYIS